MKSAIVVVAFNKPVFILKMLQAIDTFCLGKEQTDVIIVDNSWDFYITEISEICQSKFNINVIYHKVSKPNYNNPSDSHAIALNEAYKTYSHEYDMLLFLDHDCFPINYFVVIDYSYIVQLNYKPLQGIHQQKQKLYPWVGYLRIYTDKLRKDNLLDMVDFSTNQEFGLDTGGNLYRLIEHYAELNDGNYFPFEKITEGYTERRIKECLVPVPEQPYESSGTRFSLVDNRFMHYINGSNWANESEESYNLRINALEDIRQTLSTANLILSNRK